MTGFKDSTGSWLDAQKQYLDTWMQMAKHGTGWTTSQSLNRAHAAVDPFDDAGPVRSSQDIRMRLPGRGC